MVHFWKINVINKIRLNYYKTRVNAARNLSGLHFEIIRLYKLHLHYIKWSETRHGVWMCCAFKKTHYRRQPARGRVASLKARAATAVLFQIIPASIQMKSRLSPLQFRNEKIRLKSCFTALALSRNSFELVARGTFRLITVCGSVLMRHTNDKEHFLFSL